MKPFAMLDRIAEDSKNDDGRECPRPGPGSQSVNTRTTTRTALLLGGPVNAIGWTYELPSGALRSCSGENFKQGRTYLIVGDMEYTK